MIKEVCDTCGAEFLPKNGASGAIYLADDWCEIEIIDRKRRKTCKSDVIKYLICRQCYNKYMSLWDILKVIK